MTDENRRIHFLIERDGEVAAREWVERTLAIYRGALASPASHASAPGFRSQFEDAISKFEAWLGDSEGAHGGAGEARES